MCLTLPGIILVELCWLWQPFMKKIRPTEGQILKKPRTSLLKSLLNLLLWVWVKALISAALHERVYTNISHEMTC